MLPPIPSPPPGVAIANDTSTSSVRYPVFAAVVSGQVIKEYVSSSKLYYVPSTGVLNATSFAGAGTGLTGTAASLSIGGNAATATLATAATNLAGGVANNMAYQTGAGATAFITAPSTSGSYLQWTSVGGFAWTPFSGVTSFSAGTTGFTPNVSTTGAITLAGTLSAANGGTGATTLTGYVYGNGAGVMTASATIPNTAISGLGSMSTQNANSVAITGGSINGTTIGGSVAAAGSFTTLGGTTITASTQFTGPGTGLTGTAASLSIGGTAALATSLAAGSTYSIPYQSAAGTTAFLAAGTSGSILMTLGSFSAPIWTSAAALSVASANNLVGGNSGYVPYQSAASTTAFVSAGTTGQVFTSGGTGSPTWTSQSALSVGTATNIAGGAANKINYQTGAGATSFITAPTVSSTYLQWTGTAFAWTTLTTSAGGSNTQVQYNSSGSLAGSANMVFDGSTLTTLNTAYTGTLTGGTGIVNLGSGQFYKNASGYVGIGTSNPNSNLSLGAFNTAGTSNSIRLYDDAAAITSTSNNSYGFGFITNGLSYTAGSSGSHQFYTANTERMRINSSGYVGITTSSPRSALTVNGAISGISLAISTGALVTNYFPFAMNTNQTYMVFVSWNGGGGYALCLISGSIANGAVLIASSNASGGNNSFDTANNGVSNGANGVSMFYNGGYLVFQLKSNFTAAGTAYFNIFGM